MSCAEFGQDARPSSEGRARLHRARCPLQGEADGETVARLLPSHWLHQLTLRHPGDPDADPARLFDAAIIRSRTVAAHLRPMLTGMMRTLPYSRHRALRRTLLAAKAPAEPPQGQGR